MLLQRPQRRQTDRRSSASRRTRPFSAAEPGDTLIATARIIHESSQLNGTRVVVEKEDGTQIAMFRVRGYRIE